MRLKIVIKGEIYGLSRTGNRSLFVCGSGRNPDYGKNHRSQFSVFVSQLWVAVHLV